MPLVTIEPGALTLEVRADESLAQAAWRQGYHWPTTCWGEMACMVCAVQVVGGEASVLPATLEEESAISERMPQFRRTPNTRLACQLFVCGDGVVVEKAGVRPPPEAQQ